MTRTKLLYTLFATTLTCSLCVTTAVAQQSVNLVVGYPAGASYDIYMRTLARHLGKHLPGNPTVVPQNMAGTGSLRSANFLFNAAPKDGSTIGMFARGLAMQPLLDASGVQYEARRFNWIGSLTSDVSVALAWHTRPFKSLDDARKLEMIVAGTGPGSDSVIFPYILNGVLNTKFKVVTGYLGATDYLRAIERGEADGTAGVSWSTLTASQPTWIGDKKINVLVQLGLKRNPAMGSVPLVMDYAKTDSDRGVLELVFSRQDMAYPVVAPPGVPAERVAVLRKAFEATLKDPAYIADAKKQQLDIDFMRGEDIAKLLDRIYASPANVIARARAALEHGKKVTSSR
jgi:tripartite-type tricarboxylate transporter receptor subunit TctC